MPDGRAWPRITVVTPSFNQAEYLEETLRSVLFQGYPNLEYIVIDGGSTDGSVSIIERYAPRLACWVSEPDRGQSHAINKGFRHATGEILAWLNSDDIYYPGALATVAQAMESSRCDLFLGAMDKVETVGGRVRFLKRSSPQKGNPLHPRAIFRDGYRTDFHFIQPPLFWRRWIWERTGGLDERYHYVMDLEWCTRAIAAGAGLKTSEEPLARFTVHGSAKTQAQLDRAMWERSGMYLRLARQREYQTLGCLLCALGPIRRALTIGAGRARDNGKQGRAAALRMGAATAGVALRLSRRIPAPRMNPRTRRVRNQKEPAGAPSPAAVLGEAERQGPPTPCPRRDAPRVNVIGIGVQKAATTWLWKCLGEHPEIRMPRQRRGDRKELNFFNRHWERGFGWYEELFRPGPWRNIEFSTLYFHDAGVPERVYRYNPEVKLVVALRNPIDRAYSHHRHEYSKGRVPGERRDFWAAAALNPSYLEIGLYARHLERWLDWFSLEKIHVVFHDDICADPGKVLRRAFHFLEMDPGFQPASTHRTVNEAIRARIPGLNRWLRKASRGIRKGFGARVHGAVKATGVGRTLRRRNRVKVDVTDVPSLGPADRKRLAAVFRAENERLGKMLGRDLSHWI